MSTNPNSQKLETTKGKRPIHPNSLKNLIPYKPGQTGNHSNDGYTLTSALKQRLKKDAKLREQIVDSTLEGCLSREPVPFKEVWNRVDGVLRDEPAGRDINVVFVIGRGYQDAPQLVEGEQDR